MKTKQLVRYYLMAGVPRTEAVVWKDDKAIAVCAAINDFTGHTEAEYYALPIPKQVSYVSTPAEVVNDAYPPMPPDLQTLVETMLGRQRNEPKQIDQNTEAARTVVLDKLGISVEDLALLLTAPLVVKAE